ncbi:MFS general substrate transporter [Linderina pennispora]|uniref:MFS general substrate transporter n=1 Tax=Linderina pennispora TaxID=61395 RepID=A0A1Y1VZR6_9FUNG|nr:MFS general substrate transporter [Linderina pennispora]ORX66743.1 MFS general substrate transporter [Linderina pennispora]
MSEPIPNTSTTTTAAEPSYVRAAKSVELKDSQSTITDNIQVNTKGLKATITEAVEDDSHKPTLARLVAIMVSLSLASFLAGLDTSILGSALPAISNSFDGLSQVAWISAAYILTFTSLQPIVSKVSEIFGRLPVLVAALLVFCAGSAVCGAASSVTMLIAGRALAGMGGCGLVTMVQVVIIDVLPLRERGIYMSFTNLASTAAVAAGPLMGGAITDHWLWRWCFYLNIPICALILVVSILSVRTAPAQGTVRDKLKRVDLPGALLLLAGLVLLILGLNWGGKDYSWKSPAVITTLVLGPLLLVGFVCVERWVAKEPIIHLRLFTSHSTLPILVAQFFLGIGIIFTTFYMPIYFTVVRGTSSTIAGVYILPYLVGMLATGLVMGQIIARFNTYRPFIWTGLAGMTIVSGLFSLITSSTSIAVVLVLMGAFGVFSGMGLMPLMIAIQATCLPKDAGMAATLALFLRNIGQIVGIAINGAVLNNQLVKHLGKIALEFPMHADTVRSALDNGSLAWNSGLPEDVKVAIREAYAKSLKATYAANAPFVGIAFLLCLLIKHKSLGNRAKSFRKKNKVSPA